MTSRKLPQLSKFQHICGHSSMLEQILPRWQGPRTPPKTYWWHSAPAYRPHKNCGGQRWSSRWEHLEQHLGYPPAYLGPAPRSLPWARHLRLDSCHLQPWQRRAQRWSSLPEPAPPGMLTSTRPCEIRTNSQRVVVPKQLAVKRQGVQPPGFETFRH